MKVLRSKLCLGALATIAATAFIAMPAQASLHPFSGVVAKGILLPPPDEELLPFDGVCGVAVDSEGDVYLSEYRRGVVDVLSSSGDYLTKFSVATSENSSCNLATDSSGRIYVNQYHGAVARQDPSSYPFSGIPAYSAPLTIDSGRSTGVAVDPASDRLYVTHRTHVAAYEPDGTPVMDGAEPLQVGLGSLADAYGAAVSGFPATGGHVYVADAATDTVEVFDPATDPDSPVLEFDGSEVPLGEFRDLTDAALAIDDSNGHLFVLDNLQPGFEEPVATVYEFDAAGNYLGQLQKEIVYGDPSGLAVDNSIDPGTGEPRRTIYVTSGNEVRVVGFTSGGEPLEVGSELLAFCSVGPSCPVSPAHVLEVERTGNGQGAVESLEPGIECGTICAWEYDQGSQVVLFAKVRPHSIFTGWTVSGQPGACPGTTASCRVTINADTEVTANFQAIPQKALTVAKTGSGQGTVTSSPAGIECGAICIAGFDQNSTVTLTAEAAVGSEFTGWSGAGCAGTSSCKVPMGSEQSVSAEFRAISRLVPVDKDSGKRTLAISVSGEGAGTIVSDPAGIECGTPCSSAYAPGTKVTLTVKPDEESAFSGWSGCDSKTATTCTVTMGSSRTVGASFAEAIPLEIAGISLNGARATLSVAVPSKGTLSAKAKQLKPVSVKAPKAETLSVPLTLNKAAKKALAKKGKLKVKVTLSFKPTGSGTPRTLEKTITFRKKGGKR